MEEERKIIAVDYDDTLYHAGTDTIDLGLIEALQKARDELGCLIILNTCRHGADLFKALKKIKTTGFKFDLVNENTSWNKKKWGDCRKIYADLYIENNAVSADEFIVNTELCGFDRVVRKETEPE